MMKKAKLVFATLAGISVLSVAFAMASEENAGDANVIFQDIGEIEAHHDIVRVHWAMVDSGVSNGLTGDDFLKIRNGKVSEVYIIVNGWTKSGAANGQEK